MISRDQINIAMPRISEGLAKYLNLQNMFLESSDIKSDCDFQKIFAGFYRFRGRDVDWRRRFFDTLAKSRGRPVNFLNIINRISDDDRDEASFASKLVATVDPNLPVIDSFVVTNLKLALPKRGIDRRREAIAEFHGKMHGMYLMYLSSDGGRYLVERFRYHYPTADVTPIKMVDFVLWQTRPAKSIPTPAKRTSKRRPASTS